MALFNIHSQLFHGYHFSKCTVGNHFVNNLSISQSNTEVTKLQFFLTLAGLMTDNSSLHTKEMYIYNPQQKSLVHLGIHYCIFFLKIVASEKKDQTT